MDQPDFSTLRQQIFEFYRLQQWTQAITLLEGHSPHTPIEATYITFWKACFLCRAGRPDAALNALQNGVQRGLWWTEVRLRHDTDLQALQGNPAYEALIAECVQRHKTAEQTHTHTSRVVVQPDSPPPYHAMLALHGYAGNAAGTLPDWSPLSTHGWLVAALQSSQVADMDGFHWVDTDRARDDVQHHLDELSNEFALDQVALGGVSNGGRAALALTLTGAIRAKWAISIGGSLHDDTVIDWSQPFERPRVLLIAGALDTVPLERMSQQADIFKAQGVDVTLQVVPGMGHSVPHDLVERILQWI